MAEKFIQNILFCDDVRTEQTGKDIAIGIYNGQIIVPQIPFVMNIAVRLELNFFGNIIKEVGGKFRDPNGNDLAETKMAIEVLDWDQPVSVTLAFPNLILPTPGEYKLFINVGADWEQQRPLSIKKFNPEDQKKTMEAVSKFMQARMSEQPHKD